MNQTRNQLIKKLIDIDQPIYISIYVSVILKYKKPRHCSHSVFVKKNFSKLLLTSYFRYQNLVPNANQDTHNY